eukprot:CAMPEP_0172184188 /NCGR_PEP_ID=MMETSP1050-20130122/19429_1 /TAXON_ID=233186 /ORGANISM="Cryptomonas curvata, Strain CCAP979/52" /LENGTH=126 /DNA_ID=CAMNT_0012857943 /DNA_START=278 /DNA_END=658 /DNA_ORIENTATION=-
MEHVLQQGGSVAAALENTVSSETAPYDAKKTEHAWQRSRINVVWCHRSQDPTGGSSHCMASRPRPPAAPCARLLGSAAPTASRLASEELSPQPSLHPSLGRGSTDAADAAATPHGCVGVGPHPAAD